MQFRVLGPLEVADQRGRSLALTGTGLRRLLAVLVLRANETVSTDQLADALWGDQPPVGVRNALQGQVSKLRRALSSDTEQLALRTTGDGYVLDVPAGSTDLGRFETLLAEGRGHATADRQADAARALTEALAQWKGEALADFAFDEFARPIRSRLHELRLVCREERIEADLALGRGAELVAELEQLADEHPLRERLCRQLMTALYRAGRQADALRAFQRARTILVEEIGVEPGPELAAMERRILAHDPTLTGPDSGPEMAQGAGATREWPGTVLAPGAQPALSTLSTCVGRGADRALLSDLLTTRRLVTVTGPGGVGKTRIASEVAADPESRWARAVWVLELGSWDGPTAVADAIKHTFASPVGSGPAQAPAADSAVIQVAEAIGSNELLILLDNCEHVLAEAARATGMLLRHCPKLTILATSRTPLGVAGEVVHQLQPLDAAAAVELFVGRAGEASTRFSANDAELAVIERICERLDRLPLAIELAAARTRAFTLDHLAHRLGTHLDATQGRRLKVLGSADGDRPARHHTLHAAVEWSYDLLFEDERLLLDRLSVFAGGFSLEGAEAVGAGSGIDADDVADILARLVDKSLIAHQRPETAGRGRGSSRYRLLQAVAEFAAERLKTSGATDTVRHHHLQWLAGLTDGAAVGLRGPDQDRWVELLGDEEQNLGRAARWIFEGGDPTVGLRIVANLGWYCFITSRLDDYLEMGLRVLAAAPAAGAAEATRVRGYAGLLSFGRPAGQGLAAQAVDDARALGDPQLWGEMAVLRAMPLALTPGRSDDARALLAEARAAAAASGDAWVGCYAAGLEGAALVTDGDLAGGIALLAAASDDLRHLGDELSAALVDLRRSDAAEQLGDLSAASAAVDTVNDAGGERKSPIMALKATRRAWFTHRHGDHDRALIQAVEASIPDHQLCHRAVRAASALVLGATMGRAGRIGDARRHLGTAIAFYEAYGFPREAALSHGELGWAELLAGNVDTALDSHRRALGAALDDGTPTTVSLCLDGAAHALAARGRHREAAQAVGASEARLEKAGAAATTAETASRAATMAITARALGDDGAAQAAAGGAQLSPDDLRTLIPEP